jgi:DNA-binding MarR family transcriptional regulator
MTDDKILSLKTEVRVDVALSRVRRLSAQQRKIVFTLHDYPDLCNKQIARYCFTDERSITTSLATLAGKGILSKSTDNADNRKTLWRICDQEIVDAMTIKNLRPGSFTSWG